MLLLSLPLVFTLSGCIRVHTALTLSGDDQVTGTIEIATLTAAGNHPGPRLTIPSELSTKVTSSPYNANGLVGEKITFDQLTFDEVRLLATNISPLSSRYWLSLRRSGELVSLAGSVDLNQVPEDRADFEIKVGFPGTITSTNGMALGSTIEWTPQPGGVTEFTATAHYSDASTVSLTKWALRVGAGALGAALLVVLLALFSRWRHNRREERTAY